MHMLLYLSSFPYKLNIVYIIYAYIVADILLATTYCAGTAACDCAGQAYFGKMTGHRAAQRHGRLRHVSTRRRIRTGEDSPSFQFVMISQFLMEKAPAF